LKLDISELEKFGIPSEYINKLKENGYVSLYPPQILAIEKGVLDFRNVLLATPTASGKTFVAILASIKHLINGGKVLYLCPLRALASEKYEEFKNLLEFKTALSIGDYDSEDPWLKNYDVIISTYEKADSLLRHKAPWISDVSLVVIDEIHMLDSDRGPTLEFLIARLKKQVKDAQFIALSATAVNAKELAEWLSAEAIISSWRPVPLKEGVYRNGVIYYKGNSTKKIPIRSGIAFIDLALDILDEGGQALIFNSTRANAMKNSERLKDFVKKYLTKDELKELKALAEKIEENDWLSSTLKDQIINGVAFHHAGLSYNARRIVEEGFRSSLIKVVSSTTTLGAGINVPARRVIINEISRYSAGLGYSEIMTVNEYKQLAGRAGRPRYDIYGEAIIVAKGKYDVDILLENYIQGEGEPISSQIKDEKSLRSHILSLIANEIVTNEEELKNILRETFASKQVGILFLERIANKVINYLQRASFIVVKNHYIATPLGKRVSELYIDPLTAEQIVKGLKNLSFEYVNDDFYYLLLISSTEDMQRLSVFKSEIDILRDELEIINRKYPFKFDIYEDESLSIIKTAKMLKSWIDEEREDEIADKYSIGLGDLYNLIQIASWICHAAKEISKLLGHQEAYNKLSKLEERIENGVREELLELVRIPKIGRIRARILYNAGFRDIEKLSKAKEEEIISLPMIGIETYKSIKEFLTKMKTF
jgi:helicase